jgi:hypothetical protein
MLIGPHATAEEHEKFRQAILAVARETMSRSQ